MKLHKEGQNILVGSCLIWLILNGCMYYFFSFSLAFFITFVVSTILLIGVINFFRRPHRIFPHPGKQNVASPADGTIVVVEEVFESEYFKDKRIQVSIFMTIFNAHINWVPVNGKVTHVSHQPGRFVAAYLPKSSHENERSSIIIRTPEGEDILVRQIAGAMAKRIVTYVEEGQECQINEQLGFIKFGSRVDIFLPLTADIKVDLEQKVLGNKTLIAHLK